MCRWAPISKRFAALHRDCGPGCLVLGLVLDLAARLRRAFELDDGEVREAEVIELGR